MDDYLVGIGMLMVQKRVNDCKKQPTITSKADPEATKVPLLDAIISNVCQFQHSKIDFYTCEII